VASQQRTPYRSSAGSIDGARLLVRRSCPTARPARRITKHREKSMSRNIVRLLVAGSLCAAVAAALAQPLPAAKPEQVGMSTQRLARIAPALKQEIDQGRLPGAVVMVARKGKLVYSEAFGFQDKVAGTPMKTDSVF